MADTVAIPWWAKAPWYIAIGIVGVPGAIALYSVVASEQTMHRQLDMLEKGQFQTDVAQKQTQDTLDLYRRQNDGLASLIDKMTGSFAHVTVQHDKLLQMEVFTCKTAARTAAASDQCNAFMRDLNDHLVSDSAYIVLDGGKQ